MSALVYTVISASLLLVLYLPLMHKDAGMPRMQYPSSGFWWCLFSVTWALLLVVPYLAYFLRANGWCAACCGGHQQYHLSSIFKSAIDDQDLRHEPVHPGRKRPILSKAAKTVLHVFMVILGSAILITSMISFFCMALIMKDTNGSVWAFATMLSGASYIATIAFVFKQLRVRDYKRELVANSPAIVRRVLSDSEESYGRRWGLSGRYFENSDNEAAAVYDSDAQLSDSDTRHILRTSLLPDTEMKPATRLMGDDDENDGLVAEVGDLDLDENILASQLSGHSPFSLAKLRPEATCCASVQRALVVFSFLFLAALVIVVFSFQLLATYQSVSMAVDSHLIPPPGQFYAGSDVYSYQIHFFCDGPPSTIFTPTILIETDWSSVSYEWSMVTQQLLARRQDIRICRYDRAGYGWSSPGLKPRDAKTQAKELKKIIIDSGEIGPLVLVSNGYGSFIQRLFAQITDSTVMAMIMVDATHENEETEFFKALGISEERGQDWNDREEDALFQKKILAPVGIPRLQIQTAPQLNSIEQRKQLAAKGQLGFPDAVWSEFSAMWSLSSQAVASSRNNADPYSFPLTLIVSEYRINGTCEQNHIPTSKCSAFLDARDDLGDIPMSLQRDLATLSVTSRIIMAQKSSSFVHLEQPAFLASTIIDTMNQAVNITQGR